MTTRDEFQEAVHARDKGQCVCCTCPGTDVHHILDRSLWPDGGYHTDNGVLLCSKCHFWAELTAFTCGRIRDKAGIKSRVLPPGFDEDNEYDHWGNVLEPNGVRYPGPLFYKENVQKVLKEGMALGDFTWDIKYPRTYHFTYSPNVQNDDRMHKDDRLFDGQAVVATEKMDGECTTMTRDRVFARSVNSSPHESRDWVHRLHGQIRQDIPPLWRVCGENLYAEHSIHYSRLPSYFLVFSVWDETNRCLSWDDTEEWSQLLGLETVPVFYKGIWDRAAMEKAFEEHCKACADPVEGYVVRAAADFRYEAFCRSTVKSVRQNHVQTSEHWLEKAVVPNGLRKKAA